MKEMEKTEQQNSNRVTSEDILNIAKTIEITNGIRLNSGYVVKTDKTVSLLFKAIDKYNKQLDE